MSHRYLPGLNAGAGWARWPVPALLCSVLLLAAPDPAGAREKYPPYPGIETGTTGLRRVALRIENHGPGPLSCTARLAHWYSAGLGRAAPGAALEVTLWHDPATGSLEMLNADAVRMPVEAVTCGPEAQPHATRLALPFVKGPTPVLPAFRCSPTDVGYDCRAVAGPRGVFTPPAP